MRCGEIMKRSVTAVDPSVSVKEAARRMRDEEISFLPVVDAQDVVVGVVTARDIAIRATANDRPNTTLVAEVMTPEPIACRADDRLGEAEALMRMHRITRVVVTSDGGILEGVLSLSDIAQYAPPSKIGRLLQTVSQRKYASERP